MKRLKLYYGIKMQLEDSCYYLFCFAWFLYSVSSFLGSTELKYIYNVDKICWIFNYIGVIALAVIGVFLKSRYNIRKLLSIIGMIAVLFLITLFTRSYGYMTIVCLMMLGQFTDFDKIIKYDFGLKCILFFGTVSLTLAGKIPNYTALINGVTKHAYGFTHPNTFCVIAYVILLEWLYIRWKKFTVMDFILQVFFIRLISGLGGSRTSTYTYIFVFVLYILSNFFPKILYCKFSRAVLPYITIILTGVSYLFVYLYGKGNRFVVKLDEIITSRFSSGYYFLNKYGFSFFGRKIETVSTREAAETGKNAMILDSTYIRLGVVMGVVFLVIFVLMYTYIIKKALDEERTNLIVYVLFFLLIGFAESYTLGIYNNLSLIFLMGYIREKNALKKRMQAFRLNV